MLYVSTEHIHHIAQNTNNTHTSINFEHIAQKTTQHKRCGINATKTNTTHKHSNGPMEGFTTCDVPIPRQHPEITKTQNTNNYGKIQTPQYNKHKHAHMPPPTYTTYTQIQQIPRRGIYRICVFCCILGFCNVA